MEQTNIIIRVTNGIGTENLGVRVAEDRLLDHEIDASTVSKTLCAHIKKLKLWLHPFFFNFDSR